MQRRHFLQLSTAGVAGLAAPAVLSQPNPAKLKFTLDFRISGQVAPFFVALHKGYYAAEGLEPGFDVGNGSVAAITRTASGAYDMGFGDISALVEFNAAQPGAPLVQAVYQYYNRAPFVIIGRKDRGITTDFKSLQGKRIAAAAVESTRRAWPMAAKHAGMKVDAFEWVTTDFSQRDNVIIRGDVDGATYFHDSALSLFQRLDPAQLSVLSYAEAGLNLYGNAILASSRLIAEKPDLVRGFLRATNRALMETLADPVAAMAYVKRREPMIDEKVEAERFKITARYITAADTRAHGLGDVRPELVAQQVAEVSQTFGLKQAPSADGIYNLSFLPPKAERLLKA
ncbi:ABC transporter substrate-binding protein [Aquincola sp. MAHUQ-54]|uniref:ABC transporter substrate-binding protein n=1 Tax=Aquincola agrisoli TaxID=3119538 RepID=A0AAW9Q0Y5_9BURK